MITSTQVAAGTMVHAALQSVEAAHPQCPHVRRMHRNLAALRDAFKDQMTPEQFVAFGGGTPKTDDPNGGG